MQASKLLLPVLFITLLAPGSAAGAGSADEPDLRPVYVFTPAAADSHPLYAQVVDAVEETTERLPDLIAEQVVLDDRSSERMRQAAQSRQTALIVSVGNPLLEPTREAASAHPSADFLMVDGYLPELPNVVSLRIHRREQAFVAGYIAGLRLALQAEDRDEVLEAGLLFESGVQVAEEVIAPAFRLGLKAARSANVPVTRRIPRGASEEVVSAGVRSFTEDGIDTIFALLYSSRDAFLLTAGEESALVIWPDERYPQTARGRTLASIPLDVEDTVADLVLELAGGQRVTGSSGVESRTADFASGALSVNTDFDRFSEAFGEEAAQMVRTIAERLASGDLVLEMPVPER
jgi:basic membrane lipoprotein Med (substrate-binding protein (PBP1-ABC) superfamily)